VFIRENLYDITTISLLAKQHKIFCFEKCYGCTKNGLYRVKKDRSYGGSMEEVKENKKVLYHFVNFAIVNELLIIKNRRISLTYWLMQARD